MAKNAFKRGDLVILKSGGPPMTVDKVPGDMPEYGLAPLKEYSVDWFKGATAQHGSYPEHQLEKYEKPAK